MLGPKKLSDKRIRRDQNCIKMSMQSYNYKKLDVIVLLESLKLVQKHNYFSLTLICFRFTCVYCKSVFHLSQLYLSCIPKMFNKPYFSVFFACHPKNSRLNFFLLFTPSFFGLFSCHPALLLSINKNLGKTLS